MIETLATATSPIDVSSLTSVLTLEQFGVVINGLLPIAAVAVLVGFCFYGLRYFIGLFRGI